MISGRSLMAGCSLWILLAVATSATAAEHTLLQADRPAIVEMRTAALVMSGQQGGALRIAVTVLPQIGDPTQVTALIEVDGATLTASHSGSGLQVVDVHAYVLGNDLDVVDQQSLSLDLDPQHHGILLATTGLKILLPLQVTPGDHLLRILVRTGDTFGLRSQEIVGPKEEGVRILPPVFHELDEPWLVVIPAGSEIGLPPPFGFSDDSPLPTSRPILTDGETLSGQVFIRAGSGATATLATATLAALVRQPDSNPMVAPLVTLERSSTSDLEAFTVGLAARDLEAGLQEVAVALLPTTGGEPENATDALALSSYVSNIVETAKAQTAAGATQSATSLPTVSGDKPLSKAHKNLLREAKSAYRDALQQLANDDSAALATLHAAQTRVLKALDAEAITILERAESGILSRLSTAEWPCILPVAMLHLELGQKYRQEHRFILANYTAQKVVRLAETYAEQVSTAKAALEASRLISSLGSTFQLDGSLSQAKRFYSAALEVSGNEETALLGLATISEKQGRFAEAVPALEGFVAVRPDHLEGRLRLALNRARIGDVDASRKSLERLASQHETEWVALLAHQELARLEIDQERLAQAAAVLRRGLDRWSAHPTLSIQQAYVLDAQGALRASRELLEGFGSSTATHSATERSRYNTWPTDYLHSRQRALATLAAERLADLKRWLASQPAAGKG